MTVNRAIPLSEYNRQAEVAAHWYPYLDALGIADPRLSPAEIFLISGYIINDQELNKRVAAHVLASGESIVPPRLREELIRTMPEEERAALRERVLKKIIPVNVNSKKKP